jgi:hypothetical protein
MWGIGRVKLFFADALLWQVDPTARAVALGGNVHPLLTLRMDQARLNPAGSHAVPRVRSETRRRLAQGR